MSFVKILIFALSAVQSFVNEIQRQTEAEIRQHFPEGVLATLASRFSQVTSPSRESDIPKTPTLPLPPATRLPQSSPIARLPQELVDAIIAYCIYNTRTLQACSLTCYSWYIAAVRHLHYSLTTDDYVFRKEEENYRWPTPLQQSHDLGLLPLVRRFCIRLDSFAPERFCGHNLHYFSALTNLQELGIDGLQVSNFMPNIQRCFGHFAPTLRLLALKNPEGSPRQILYFIGLFPNLQDLKLYCLLPKEELESTADADLIPLSVPPLRGRLTLTCFTRERLVKDMMALFGGLHFRSMDLFKAGCTRLLLRACAETLETLRLYPTDLRADDGPVSRRFDLSRNKSLRTLETTAGSIDYARGTASGFLRAVLSTTMPALSLNVVITHHYQDFNLGVSNNTRVTCMGDSLRNYSAYPRTQAYNAIRCSERFKVLREMHEVRKFQLVLCADVFDCVVKKSMGVLKRIVEAERARGGLDYLECEPSIIYEVRASHSRPCDPRAGEILRSIPGGASAL